MSTQVRQALHTLADALADLLQTPDAFGAAPAPQTPPAPVKEEVTVEVTEEPEEPAGPSLKEVRKALADFAHAGRRDDVKAALGDLGVSKLSDVAERDYQRLLDSLNG